MARPTPLHPTKKHRTPLKLKDDQLAEACLQSTANVNKLLQTTQLKHQHFGDYIAKELQDFDSELVLLAKNRINNVIFEIGQMQLEKRK